MIPTFSLLKPILKVFFYWAIFINFPLVKINQRPPIDEWINKILPIYTTEYDSAIKRNEVLIIATVWMNLKNIRLSERS